jgi:hypothetical protein
VSWAPSLRRGLPVALLVAFALLLSVYAWSMALDAYPHTSAGDGPFEHEMLEAVRASWSHYRELPLWNAYQCGGVPLWDNPAGLGAAPLVWVMLGLFDTTHMMALWFVVHSALGFLCMWALARGELRMSVEASLLASATWAFCGPHSQHFNGGSIVWASFLYFPLAIYLWRRAETDTRMAIALGGLVAWTMHEGGTYPLPHLVLLLGAETLTRVWQPSRMKAIVRAAAIVGVVGFLLGASRFLPVLDQMKHHTRSLNVEHDALQWETLKSMFLDRIHSRRVQGQEYVWPEFGAYVGPFVLALAFLGVALTGIENAWLLWLLVWAFLLMLGHVAPYAPWAILKGHIFPFKEMRVPSRFSASVCVFVAAFAGLAVDRLTRLARRWSGSARVTDAVRIALVAIGFCGVGDILNAGFIWQERNGFGDPPENANVAASPHFYLDGPGLAEFIDQPRQNRGRTACWEEWAFESGAPLWVGDVPQAKPADDASTVTSVSRTQNTFTIDVDARRPARVWLNSAYDRGWRASVGEVVREGKLLAVDVPAGNHHVIVRYWPHGLTLGFVMTGGTLAWIVYYFVADGRRRRARRDAVTAVKVDDAGGAPAPAAKALVDRALRGSNE